MTEAATKKGWREVTFGEIFDISSSKRVLQEQWQASGVPFYRAREIVRLAKNGVVENELFISEKLFDEYRKKFGAPAAGDLMVSAVGTLGACYVVQPKDRFYYKDASVLRFSPKKTIHSKFIQYAFGTNQVLDQVNGGSGSTVGTFTIERANKTRMMLPPLEEQRRIADLLDRAEALRANRRAALAQLETLTQSIFLDMLGDPARNPKGFPAITLGDLVTEFRYGSSNKSANQGKPALRIPNIAGGTIDLIELKLVPVDTAEFERLRLRDGDLLFVRTNGNPDFVGRCAVFDGNAAATSGFSGNDFIFASYLIRARLAGDIINPVFLREYLLGAEGRRQLRSRSKTSAGQYNINTEGLGAISVPLPPIEVQHAFAHRIVAVEKLKATHRSSLAELDGLFASLQHCAFRGEL